MEIIINAAAPASVMLFFDLPISTASFFLLLRRRFFSMHYCYEQRF
jgi:hypothetical protein